MNLAIAHCLRADTAAEPTETVAQWWPTWLAICNRHAEPIERAVAAGFAADRVAWAFAGGYQAALRALSPALPNDALAALCVTEETGNRPSDIQTTITHHACHQSSDRLPNGSLQRQHRQRWRWQNRLRRYRLHALRLCDSVEHFVQRTND